jgi:transcriptional regulator with XRE-family HTH domain
MGEKALQFGQFLKELRIAKGLTLIELGERIHLSNPYLSQIENGKRGIPTPELLEKLAEVFDVPFIELLDKVWRIKNKKPIIDDPELFDYDLSNLLYYKNLNFKGHVLTKEERQGIETILNALFPDNDNQSWFKSHWKADVFNEPNEGEDKTK